jgi:hypothetical protein
MIRRILLSLLLVAAFSSDASAYPISNNNPYRSFNITGINYGSMQWERDHRGGGSGYHSYRSFRSHGRLFRR